MAVRFSGGIKPPVGIVIKNPPPVVPPAVNHSDWTSMTRGLGTGETFGNFRSLATDEDGVWVAGMDAGYATRSIDNGATWSSLPRGLNAGSNNDKLAIDTNGNDVWYAVGSDGYTSYSEDNGATWSAGTRGLNSGSTSVDVNDITNDRTNGRWMSVHNSGRAARNPSL